MYIPTLCPAAVQVSANCFRASCLSSSLHRLSILVCTLSTQTALRSPGLGSVLIELSETKLSLISTFSVSSMSIPESLEKASLRACSGGNISEGQKGQEKSRLGEQHYGGTKWMIRGTGGELNCQVRGAVQKRLTKTSLMLENGLGVRKE